MHTPPPRSSPHRSPPPNLDPYPSVMRPVDSKRASPSLPPPRRANPSPLRSLHPSPPTALQTQPLPRPPVLLPSSRASAVLQTLPAFQHAPPRRPSPPPPRLPVEPSPPSLYPHPLRVSISPLVHDPAHPPPPPNGQPPPPPARIPPPSHLHYPRSLPVDPHARSLPPPHFDVYHMPHPVQPRLVDRAPSPVLLPVLNNPPPNNASQQQPHSRPLHSAPSHPDPSPEDSSSHPTSAPRLDHIPHSQQQQTHTLPPPHSQSQPSQPNHVPQSLQQSRNNNDRTARHSQSHQTQSSQPPQPQQHPPQQQSSQQQHHQQLSQRQSQQSQQQQLQQQQRSASERDSQKHTAQTLNNRLPPPETTIPLPQHHVSLPLPPPADPSLSPSRPSNQTASLDVVAKTSTQPNLPHQPMHIPPQRSMPHEGYGQPPGLPIHYAPHKPHWRHQQHLIPPPHHRPPPPHHVMAPTSIPDHSSYQPDPHWHVHHPHSVAVYNRAGVARPHPSAPSDPTKPQPHPNWPPVRFPSAPGTPPRGPLHFQHHPLEQQQDHNQRKQGDHLIPDAHPYPYQTRPQHLLPESQHAIDPTLPTATTSNLQQRSLSPAPLLMARPGSVMEQHTPPSLSTVPNGPPRQSGAPATQLNSSRNQRSPHLEPTVQPPAPHDDTQGALPQGASNDHAKQPAQRERDRERPIQSLPQAPQQGADGNAASQRRELKVEDALAYLENVKSQFADDLNVYNQFLDIMKAFKAQSIDTSEVIYRVSFLFRGHKELILGFNTFLPPGYNIYVTEGANGTLKLGFDGPSGFKELPSLIKPPKNSNSRSNSKKRQNAANSTATASASALSPKRKDSKKPLHISSSTQLSNLNAQPFHSSSAAHRNLQPSATHPAESSDKQDTVAQTLPGPEKQSGPTNRALTSRRGGSKQSAIEDEMPPQQAANMSRQPAVKQEETPHARAIEFERAMGFVTSIKERFAGTPKTFTEFLETLTRFRSEQTSIREVFETVASLFGPHKDLLVQFKEFLPTVAITGFSDTRSAKNKPSANDRSAAHSTPPRRPTSNGVPKGRHRSRDMKFFDELKIRLGPSKIHLYTEFIKCLSLFSQQIVSREELLRLTSEILRDDLDAYQDFLHYLNNMGTAGGSGFDNENMPSSISFEGEQSPVDQERINFFKSHSMTEIAIEHGVEVRGSYRRIPPDYPNLEYSGRSMHERRTLNDTWINVTRGTEDYSFKFMRKNQSEDNLFRCEDDRYELDLVIETNAATIMKLETIEATISTLQEGDKKRHALAPNALSPIHFNAIQRIYGESGPEVVSQVKLNPFLAVPVVLKRLKEKDISWRRARMEMNRVWREVGERNFHRSLDHRSPCFKAVDKKDLSTKSLLSDILDPAGSVAAREAEVTRNRGYAVENGGGGSNHRSQALEAVSVAAKKPAESPRALSLRFESKVIHDFVFEILNHVVDENGKQHLSELRSLINALFEVNSSLKETKKSDETGKTNQARILYGDESVYLMVRLYHFMFERIKIAQTLCQEQVADRKWRQRLNKEGRKNLVMRTCVPSIESKPWHITKGLNGAEIDNKFKLGPETETSEEIFAVFLNHAKAFARGKLEWAKFEDKLRVLLGADSYCLFTLDKVVQKLVKAIEVVYNKDGHSRPFCELFLRTHSLLEKCKRNEGKLDEHGVDMVQSVAVCKHIVETRNPGTNLMRFKCSHDHEDCNVVDINMLGHTAEEDGLSSRRKEAELRDEFLGFCSLFGDYAHDQNLSENERLAEDSQNRSSDEAGRKRARTGEASDDKKTKRRRVSDPDFLRFIGEPEIVLKRLQKAPIAIRNELQWTFTPAGKIEYTTGTSDFFMNMSRPFGRDWSSKRVQMNEENTWVQKLRKKLNIQPDEGGENKLSRDVHMTDGDTKEQAQDSDTREASDKKGNRER